MVELDTGTYGGSTLFHGCADGIACRLFHKRDYPRRCEDRNVTASKMNRRIRLGDGRCYLSPGADLVFHRYQCRPRIWHGTRTNPPAAGDTMQLDRDENVFVLTMDDDENRFNDRWVADFNAALDTVEAAAAPRALVTTGAGRFYSNGLDLEWLTTTEGLDMRRFVADAEKVLARMLSFPAITVAALNGHTFAAGAMLALAHDFRIMREDRGFFCLPEVDIKIPFTEGMNGLVMQRLPTMTAHRVMVTGGRFAGPEGVELGIVDQAEPKDNVLPAAIKKAAELADKDATTLGAIKQRMYADTIHALENSTGTAPPGM